MNPNENTPNVNHASGAAVGFVLASVIFIVLVIVVRFSMPASPVDANRASFISQNLYQIRTNEVASLNSAAWIDHGRGIVRLPIETAMQMTAQEWQNPSEARADLIARAQKAAAPAPKKPAAANPFE